MCGINGFLGFESDDLISKMNLSISHRGPDSSGFFTSPLSKVSLGHVRLSIIDLSPESNQPLFTTCKRFSLVFNGEIYNYRELKASLEAKGEVFSSNGDGEVLLRMWQVYGKSCLSSLDGIFSFAIFDSQDKRLYLVRDGQGVKPLYYSMNDSGFIFSSEIKAILQSELVPREIDKEAVFNYLKYLWSPGPKTILKAVKKLEPGAILTVEEDLTTYKEIYYKLPEYEPSLNEKESILGLQSQLEEAVQSQLVSDVSVGAFLSGGLDSSLLCAIAKQKNNNFSDVFTIDTGDSSDGFEADLPYAKKVAEKLDLNLNIVNASPRDIENLPECIFYLDEPQSDPAIINTYSICKLAREKGIKVLLSGAGGDDLFTGYRRHLLASYQQKIDRIPKIFKHLLSVISNLFPNNTVFFRRFKKLASSLGFNGNNAIASYFSWIETPNLKRIFLDQSINTSSGEEAFLEKLSNSNSNNVEKTLNIDKSFFLVDHNFNYTDKMSMAHGVEVRVPYARNDMLEFASKIPSSVKQKNGVGKYVLKKAAELYLDKEVIYRSKTGFGAPIRDWIKGPLKPISDTLLSKENIEKRGLFNYEEVQRLIKQNDANERDYSYTIYGLITLEIWMKQFIDNDKPKPLTFSDLMKK